MTFTFRKIYINVVFQTSIYGQTTFNDGFCLCEEVIFFPFCFANLSPLLRVLYIALAQGRPWIGT